MIMNSDDEIFIKTANLLRNNHVNYWICHGTLLGIMREDRLLPWDHDIDFAVWSDETSKESILALFLDAGYTQEIVMDEYDNLFFSSNNKRIDINFYRRKDGVAYAKWVSPTSNSFVIKLYYFIVSEWCYKLDISRIKVNKGMYRFSKWIFIQLLLLIKPFIPNSVKTLLLEDVKKRLKYTGYSYPEELMVFNDIDFMNIKVPVPVDYKKYLELTYGSDWGTPKKNYIWFHEAKNLLEHN